MPSLKQELSPKVGQRSLHVERVVESERYNVRQALRLTLDLVLGSLASPCFPYDVSLTLMSGPPLFRLG